MAPGAYAFIDGASFEPALRSMASKLNCTFDEIMWSALTRNAERIFYFDALPVKKDSESVIDFERKLEDKKLMFAKLRRVPNLHVREGITRFRKNSNGPGLTQKGVDVALAVEVLSHAHRGTIHTARLFVSDLDFYPLLDALTSTRVRSELWYLPKKTAPELLEAADVSTELNYYHFIASLPAAQMAGYGPSGVDEDTDDYERVGTGSLNGMEVVLSKSPREDKFVLRGPYDGRSSASYATHMSRCSEVLVEHLEACARATVTWKDLEE